MRICPSFVRRATAGSGGRVRRGDNKPFSETYLWDVWMKAAHRAIFAAIIGTIAVAASTVLWIVSSPWVAWCIISWRFPVVRHQFTTLSERLQKPFFIFH